MAFCFCIAVGFGGGLFRLKIAYMLLLSVHRNDTVTFACFVGHDLLGLHPMCFSNAKCGITHPPDMKCAVAASYNRRGWLFVSKRAQEAKERAEGRRRPSLADKEKHANYMREYMREYRARKKAEADD